MPGATPNWGFPYSLLGEQPNGPDQLEDLAQAIDAVLLYGIKIVSAEADLAAITPLVNGRLAVTTDTGTLWVRRSSAWVKATPSSVTHRTATGFGTTTSTSYVNTLTGGAVAGVAFTAPASGQVTIFNSVYLFNSGANGTYCGIRVRAGNSVGAGSDVLAASDTDALINTTASGAALSRPYMLAGLTPGSDYNVQQWCRVDAGTGTFNRHSLVVTPS